MERRGAGAAISVTRGPAIWIRAACNVCNVQYVLSGRVVMLPHTTEGPLSIRSEGVGEEWGLQLQGEDSTADSGRKGRLDAAASVSGAELVMCDVVRIVSCSI